MGRCWPKQFPLVPDERLASMGCQQFIVKSYRVFIAIDEKSKGIVLIRLGFSDVRDAPQECGGQTLAAQCTLCPSLASMRQD